MPQDALWREILEYGILSPCPHNTQPWRFRLETDGSVTLLYDPERLLPDTDPTGRFCMAGFGILLEMLSIAAAPHGFKVAVSRLTATLDPHKAGLQPLAKLTLVERKAEEAESLDRQLIRDRRTSRLPYDDVPVADSVLEELASIARASGHELEFSTERSQVNWVVRLNASTMFFDMSEPLSRNEVGRWIRYSRREASQKADGLAAYAMLFPGWLMKLFVKHNYLFAVPGVKQLALSFYAYSMRGTRTVAWLSGPFEHMDDWENAGRMMARLWLTMTLHGVYLHPFGSVITNPRSHQMMARHFANQKRAHDLWLLVRLGHSDEPPCAMRLPLDQLIVP